MRKPHLLLLFALIVAGTGGWLAVSALEAPAPEAVAAPADSPAPAAVAGDEATCAEEVDFGALSFLPAPTPKGCIPCTIGQPPRCPNCGIGNPGVCNGTCCECLN
jgi:hypothetical protein